MCVSLPEAINFLGIYQECHFEPFNRSHPQPPSPKKTEMWDQRLVVYLIWTGGMGLRSYSLIGGDWNLNSIDNLYIYRIYSWLVVWNHGILFSSQLGMLSSQLTFTPFFRGVAKNHQPVFGISSHCSIITKTSVVIWHFQGTPMFAAPMSSERGVEWEKRWYRLVN